MQVTSTHRWSLSRCGRTCPQPGHDALTWGSAGRGSGRHPSRGTLGYRDQTPVPQWLWENYTWTTACMSVCSLCPPTTPMVDVREGKVLATEQS